MAAAKRGTEPVLVEAGAQEEVAALLELQLVCVGGLARLDSDAYDVYTAHVTASSECQRGGAVSRCRRPESRRCWSPSQDNERERVLVDTRLFRALAMLVAVAVGRESLHLAALVSH